MNVAVLGPRNGYGTNTSMSINNTLLAQLLLMQQLPTGEFSNPAFCTLIPLPASPPFIHGKSRMRKRACTDLRGGRSAMVVPTATTILTVLGKATY